MLRAQKIWCELLLAGMCIAGAAQSAFSQGNSTSPPTSKTPSDPQSGSQSQGTPPAPPMGGNPPILNPENPPLSGLDEPSLELRPLNRSFISTAIQVGESGDSNANNAVGGSQGDAVTHLLGAVDLQKFWPRSDLFLEYLGGVVEGDERSFQRQLHALGLEGVTRWRTGQITVRDGFSYLPDGSFSASSAGGLPGFGIATGRLGLGLPGVFHLEE